MNSTLAGRAVELVDKLALLRRWLEQARAGAVRLRGIDWFAWATAGGSNAVLLTSEMGVAEVLVTPHQATILTDVIEAQRLKDEQVPAGFSFHVDAWAEPSQREQFVLDAAGGAPILSDRPAAHEHALPMTARNMRMVLSPPEQSRLRETGMLAAAAMTQALRAARPEWTEYQLAAAGAGALCERGLEPALVLAAGAERLARYRHPVPSCAPLGAQAMLVFCARRHGLYANLTRCVAFGAAPQGQAELMGIEATGLAACVEGNSLAAVYHALAQAYRHAGLAHAIAEHHQGGVTGYQAREMVATANTALELRAGMALAFNPSVAGNKIEDTFLLTRHGLENLTLDQEWPAAEVAGRLRPLWLELS
jgi:Xaa-Pro aminopeptidase